MQPLWNHQVHGIRVAEKLKDLGLLYEQGTGKTRTMIEILRRRYAHASRLKKTLVLCPVIVCENWKAEFAKYSKINPRDIVILTGAGKSRVRTLLKEVGDDLARAKIIVTNYEAVQMDELFKLLMLWTPEVLVCDESQRLKNPSSKRAKKVVALADLSSENFILTGTPILQSPMDLFMQFRVLDRGKTFGKNFFSFRNTYFMDKNAGMPSHKHFPNWVGRYEMYGKLQERVKEKALRVLKKDCLDLPPLVRQEIGVTLASDQARAYREMSKEYLAFIESKTGEPRAVVAQLAITKALRLQQIVSGFAVDSDGVTHRFTDCPRLKALEELLEDITPGNKVIVWATFKENYRMIAEVCQKLKLQYRELHGDVPMHHRQQAMQDFREDPHVRVMIANQGAGGVGVNLVEASYAVYYSKNFRLEDDLQSEARNYRGGSEMHAKVTRIDLVARDTIDDLITKALHDKLQVSDLILGWKP
jgi:SNF2 family DNA or RNA helicase